MKRSFPPPPPPADPSRDPGREISGDHAALEIAMVAVVLFVLFVIMRFA